MSVSAEHTGQHDEYLQWSGRLWQCGGERRCFLLCELQRTHQESPAVDQGVPRPGLRRCFTEAFQPVNTKVLLYRVAKLCSNSHPPWAAKLIVSRMHISSAHTPLCDDGTALISDITNMGLQRFAYIMRGLSWEYMACKEYREEKKQTKDGALYSPLLV